MYIGSDLVSTGDVSDDLGISTRFVFVLGWVIEGEGFNWC